MTNTISVATLGGHSALEICLGAKRQNFQTVVIAQKGREKTYTTYFANIVDTVVFVDHFRELTQKMVMQELQKRHSIFIPHRYCQAYCDIHALEHELLVPIFGNKYLLKYEEREGRYTQYQLLDASGILYPKRFTDPKSIDRLVLVKVKEAKRKYERAFFFAHTYDEYQKKSNQLIRSGNIEKKDLESAVIEEYLVGVQVNFNFFYSSLADKIELLGTDTRRQTNIDGLIRIPMQEQMELKGEINPCYIESGHIAVTVKESLIEKAFVLAEKLIKGAKKISKRGIIGPFALQSVILPGPPEERLVVFDVSFRIPGSPGTMFTPYSYYTHMKPMSFGDRIALEIGNAVKYKRLPYITT